MSTETAANDPGHAPRRLLRLPEVIARCGPVNLKPCPFCAGRVFLHHGHNGIAFITCGQRDDGADGCGAVVSFRPNMQGSEAAATWNKRSNARIEPGRSE